MSDRDPITGLIIGAAIEVRKRVGCGLLENAYHAFLCIELKTVTAFSPIHEAQILTYLRLAGIRTGLLINFHAVPFKTGIKRFVV